MTNDQGGNNYDGNGGVGGHPSPSRGVMGLSSEEYEKYQGAVTCAGGIGLLLLLVLVPISFSYVEYYEYGLKQRKSTGAVDTDKIYGPGRYVLGPDYTFLKYRADAHHETLDNLGVFSAGGSNSSIGLEFILDIDLTYQLRRSEVGKLHRELASSYSAVISSRAKDAIKNEAIFISFNEYFQKRRDVEQRLRDAVQKRWNADPPLHADLDQFHVGRIQIPDSVARKQLESKLQNERNDKESYDQQAQVERDMTDVEVNAVLLEKEKVLREARAYASLTEAKGKATAQRIVDEAQNDGYKMLFDKTKITTQEHKAAFDYLRTLTNKEDIEKMSLSYLSGANYLQTKQV